MARERITFPVNLRQNVNDDSTAYGKWFPVPSSSEPMSLKGLDERGRSADTRTPAQRAALIALLRSLKVDYPNAEIVGHRELEGVHKDCPSFSCSEYRDYFKHLNL